MSVKSNTMLTLKNDKTLIDLFRDEVVADECLTGIITDFNEHFCYMNLVNDDGTENGISVVITNDITRIRWEGNERDSISSLMEEKNTKLFSPSVSLGSMREIIESIQSRFGYVNINTEYMDDTICFIGEVEQIDDEYLLLHEYGTMISRDRHRLLISLNEISRIDAGSQYEKDIVFLGKQDR